MQTHRLQGGFSVLPKAPRDFLGRQKCCRQTRFCRKIVAAAQEDASQRALAPVKVKTPVGKMLDYYLKVEPHLLHAAIEKQLEALKEEKSRMDDEASSQPNADKSELVLYRRIHEMRRSEERATIEELMYIWVLEKFVALGVQMMPRVDSMVYQPTGSVKALTEGIHSTEAVQIVKEHVRAMMGQAVLAHDSTLIKMPKLQAVQMYVMSIMFGYFIRRVDKRFQLERSAGLLEDSDSPVSSDEEALSRLERLFSEADSMDTADSPDSPSSRSSSEASTSGYQSDAVSSTLGGTSSKSSSRPESKFKEYVNSFGPETARDMAKVVSQEATKLIEMQTVALFGDYRALQKQMEQAIGNSIISVEDLMERVQQKIESGEVEATTFTVGAQRRAVLEAIAFGTFLQDVESSVDSNYGLLTAAKSDGFGPSGFGQGPSGPNPGNGGGGSKIKIS